VSWEVGQRIRTGVLRHRRAAFGEEILATLSQELAVEFGNGFSSSVRPTKVILRLTVSCFGALDRSI
jgi:hypothetical protein